MLERRWGMTRTDIEVVATNWSTGKFHYTRRMFMKRVTEKDLQQEVARQGEVLDKIIDTYVVGDAQGNSFLSKQEIERLLDNHFIRVENLLKTYDNQPKKPSLYEELREDFKTLSEDFKESVTPETANLKRKATQLLNSNM